MLYVWLCFRHHRISMMKLIHLNKLISFFIGIDMVIAILASSVNMASMSYLWRVFYVIFRLRF